MLPGLGVLAANGSSGGTALSTGRPGALIAQLAAKIMVVSLW